MNIWHKKLLSYTMSVHNAAILAASICLPTQGPGGHTQTDSRNLKLSDLTHCFKPLL